MEILKVEKSYKKPTEAVKTLSMRLTMFRSRLKRENFLPLSVQAAAASQLFFTLSVVLTVHKRKNFCDGNDISKMNDDKLAVFRRRQVGIVYQFYNLIPILTVEKHPRPPCDLDGRGVDRERLEMILDSFGLRARRKHLPNQLSGGQQQRTSIARALINNPSLVLADEPTGNLDSKSSEEVMSMLKMCNQSYGQTVIMITHNLDIAKQADRIITISDGKIVEEA